MPLIPKEKYNTKKVIYIYFLKYILRKWEKHYINKSINLPSSQKSCKIHEPRPLLSE